MRPGIEYDEDEAMLQLSPKERLVKQRQLLNSQLDPGIEGANQLFDKGLEGLLEESDLRSGPTPHVRHAIQHP
jgi:hypothetical protein